MDMKEKKLTLVGEVDAVEVVEKLRKQWKPQILTIGPAKEPEKKQNDEKKDDGINKEIDNVTELFKQYYSHYNYYTPYYRHYYHY